MDALLWLRGERCIFCRDEAQRAELRSTADGFARTFAVCHQCWQDGQTDARLQAMTEAHAQQRARETL